MLCWYCHWGWPKKIRDIYNRAVADIDEFILNWPCETNDWTMLDDPCSGEQAMENGPAHCVWSDENFDSVKYELEHLRDPLFQDWPLEITDIIKRSLLELDALPQEIRNSPKGYDGERPENFPPPPEWEVSK